ncbi:hypothetical protein KSP40_PGU012489 [Platanthera guangdongensis]|uniref:peptide-methionine (S)-S-oxide reductase n=1 Tax=Platanthera guangdongensis TaxID=2320717 RepID=A0ABR2LNZ0_9ASPA
MAPAKVITTRPAINFRNTSRLQNQEINHFTFSAMSASEAEIALGPDEDVPAAGQQFAQFAAGCFWGVELAFQRVAGVTKTEVGYSQGKLHNPTYEDVCTDKTGHAEIVRVQFDPDQCRYDYLLHLFWSRHDPTTLNRQKHIKQGQGHEGGIFTVEAPLHVSNVLVLDPVSGRPCKIGYRFMEDGTKVRISRGREASGEIIPRPEILKMRRKPQPVECGPKDTPLEVVLEKTYDARTGIGMPDL